MAEDEVKAVDVEAVKARLRRWIDDADATSYPHGIARACRDALAVIEALESDYMHIVGVDFEMSQELASLRARLARIEGAARTTLGLLEKYASTSGHPNQLRNALTTLDRALTDEEPTK
jgi:hypothetical protein